MFELVSGIIKYWYVAVGAIASIVYLDYKKDGRVDLYYTIKNLFLTNNIIPYLLVIAVGYFWYVDSSNKALEIAKTEAKAKEEAKRLEFEASVNMETSIMAIEYALKEIDMLKDSDKMKEKALVRANSGVLMPKEAW
jgi:hypothetical protein